MICAGLPNHVFALELPGVVVEAVRQIDSTNSELMRRARAGNLQPVLLVAQQQTAGRGRLGRSWHSDLAFSLGLPLAPHDWSGLSLAVGVSLVESLHPDLRLKWPNDVWWRERKLAGVLIETASFAEIRYLVVGIGINITKPEATDLATAPAWLEEVWTGVDAAQALLRIAPPLLQAVKLFEAQGFEPFQSRFNHRDALVGLTVALSDDTIGVAHGVDKVGALLVDTAQGLKKIISAEVSVRHVRKGSS